MASPVPVIIQCMAPGIKDPEIALKTFKGFQDLIEGFFKLIPELINPGNIPKLLPPEFPKFAFDLITSGLDKEIVPSFGLKFLGIEIGFTGKKQAPTEPVFDPKGIIDFITGLLNTGLGIINLFIDLDKKLPLPVIPTPNNIILALSKLIESNFGLTGLIEAGTLPEGFGIKFSVCLIKQITSLIGAKVDEKTILGTLGLKPSDIGL